MKTIILLSTQTSATGSICRIIETINTQRKFYGLSENKVKFLSDRLNKIPEENHIILHNRPDLLKFIENPEKYRYILNFRDPRDRLCNKFHWMKQHALYPNEDLDKINDRKKELEEIGINKWVTDNVDPNYEESLFNFVDNIDINNLCVNTYIDLCENFNIFITKLAKFLGEPLSKKTWHLLEPERSEKLLDNKDWIGGQWTGADTTPGRYKNELNENTISYINEIYSNVLDSMRKYDKNNKSFYEYPKHVNIKKTFSKINTNSGDPADLLREIAFAFENIGDIQAALKLMEKAHILRPNGPKIKRKINEYKTLLDR